jgi:hypothetical protein
MLRGVAPVGTYVSEEYVASITRVKRICELGTTLAVTSKQSSALPPTVGHARYPAPLSTCVPPHTSTYVTPHTSTCLSPHTNTCLPPHTSTCVPSHTSTCVPPHTSTKRVPEAVTNIYRLFLLNGMQRLSSHSLLYILAHNWT